MTAIEIVNVIFNMLLILFIAQGGCKLLYVLTRYSRSSNYLWMFFEGFYLHRLIANAFEPPKSLAPFYIIGWGKCNIVKRM